ncbi:MAG: UDP-N-acetylglucosamine--N-acetylmuramyl-(pentapeptide) pyrophosphoryl-undecaprenol N-acetylglucosamine transferase [Clostridia bacterium]|nr:UDP-N-acetylglucosamine--N-acetylmuramyl-(pentapeptide) pyrophosphoryl-undecaprenol N-acetylglucosamine transferase [Clostridia bacterium]
MHKILFTGGGSAGHVVPSVALINELLKTGKADLFYMGTDGIEKRIISDLHLPYYEIHCPKLIRGGLLSLAKNLSVPIAYRKAKAEAKAGLEKIKPDLVFSKGGYVALPVVAAAHDLGIPCLTHESDFSLGLANKLMAKKCKKVLTAFPETANTVKNGKYCGAPLRAELFTAEKKDGKKRFGITDGKPVLLVFGGGSGSDKINAAVRRNVLALTENYNVIHVCGRGKTLISKLNRYYQYEFLNDMPLAYACADVVLCRAGAGALFEILALKKKAIFVPLEGQTRGDQLQNATYFKEKGLCHVLREQALTDNLPAVIEQTLKDDKLAAALAVHHFHNGTKNVLFEIRNALKK